jgi:hypothetical protein
MAPAKQSQWMIPDDLDQDGRIRGPELLPEFSRLVRRAISVQHGSLTTGQFEKLEMQFFKARQPMGSPIFGWAIGNELMLRQALAREGVTVRVKATRPLHPYRLSKTGLKRLDEIEAKINRAQQRAEKMRSETKLARLTEIENKILRHRKVKA